MGKEKIFTLAKTTGRHLSAQGFHKTRENRSADPCKPRGQIGGR